MHNKLPPGVMIVKDDTKVKQAALSIDDLSEALSIGMSVEVVIDVLGEPGGRDKYVSYHSDGSSYDSETLLYGKTTRINFDGGSLSGWSVQEGSAIIRKSLGIKFAAIDDDRHLVYGIVMEPDEVDTQGDITSSEEIEKAAHRFMERSRVMGKGHKDVAKAMPVESYIASTSFDLGGQQVKAGSWVMASKVLDDELWEAIKGGDFTGFSIGAYTRRVEIETEEDVA